MKKAKRVISLLLCVIFLGQSMLLTSFAETSSVSALSPPPELIILEGEEWIPDAVDPSTISTYGVDDDCRHNGAVPKNYRYIGAVRGNTSADVHATNAFTGVVGLLVGGPFGKLLSIFSVASEIISIIFPGDKLEGNYIKYQYIYNFGPDPNMYWFHTFYSFATKNGEPVGSTCEATYSPKKSPSDFFQD